MTAEESDLTEDDDTLSSLVGRSKEVVWVKKPTRWAQPFLENASPLKQSWSLEPALNRGTQL